jgi:LPXTG-site transpeptidase (sortase) family protein
MRVSLYLKLLPLYIGLAALAASPFYLAHLHVLKVQAATSQAQVVLNKPKVPTEIKTPLSGKPVRIILPAQSIDVSVVNGYYVPSKKSWYVAPAAANYAPNTALINNSKGTTLIYGHALSYVFGATKNIKKGDTAIVYTDNGHIFQYVFDSEISVNPTDVEIFSEVSGNPTLKLMTCGGTWYQNRRIMAFNLVKAV